MAKRFTTTELESYLDEALAPHEMAMIEEAMRQESEMNEQISTINSRRDAGVHSLGEVWRRHRVSCPTREQLGSYLLGALSNENSAYLKFHLEKIGCRYCQANLEDLQRRQTEANEIVVTRQRKYLESSAGFFPGEK
ncbi:MAG: hypothetical protein MK165_02270 [Pirellulaceae bacterium]|nr:hypothetical protein [Pirellulaceae bacterium]